MRKIRRGTCRSRGHCQRGSRPIKNNVDGGRHSGGCRQEHTSPHAYTDDTKKGSKATQLSLFVCLYCQVLNSNSQHLAFFTFNSAARGELLILWVCWSSDNISTQCRSEKLLPMGQLPYRQQRGRRPPFRRPLSEPQQEALLPVSTRMTPGGRRGNSAKFICLPLVPSSKF